MKNKICVLLIVLCLVGVTGCSNSNYSSTANPKFNGSSSKSDDTLSSNTSTSKDNVEYVLNENNEVVKLVNGVPVETPQNTKTTDTGLVDTTPVNIAGTSNSTSVDEANKKTETASPSPTSTTKKDTETASPSPTNTTKKDAETASPSPTSTTNKDSASDPVSSGTGTSTKNNKEEASGDKIDLDITEAMYVTMINAIYTNPQKYLGKTVRIQGMFSAQYFQPTDTTYYYVYRVGPGCCGNDGSMCGFEFTGNTKGLEDNDWIDVTGTLDSYDENGVSYLTLRTKSVEVKTTRGKESVAQ